MEDDKLAAYYDDLTRRGGGAARFKQGLGFSSATSSDAVPSKGSSFLSSFVRASSPSKTTEYEKQAQLQSIQNKLSSKRPKEEKARNRSRSRSPTRRSKDRRRSRSRDISSRRRSRSRSRGTRHRRRSRSSSRERYSKRRSRSRSREKRGSRRGGGSDKVDDGKLIEGYENMTPAERVKAKMNLQLSRTAQNDEKIGKGSGWERFDFDKDAPLDDEEFEAADDDASVVKHVGQSFRFTASEATREEKLKSLHDDAIFGGSSHPLSAKTDEKPEEEERSYRQETMETSQVPSLLSDQVRTKQQGSWRDRVRKS